MGTFVCFKPPADQPHQHRHFVRALMVGVATAPALRTRKKTNIKRERSSTKVANSEKGTLTIATRDN